MPVNTDPDQATPNGGACSGPVLFGHGWQQ